MTNQIAIFKGKQIRKIIYNNEWWFSIIDIIEILTGSDRSRKYWSDLKKKLIAEGYIELSEKIGQLKLMANDGKYYSTDCANTETILRIIQSIPSPKVEPLKRWLAKVGYEPAIVIASDRRERSNLWLNNPYDRKQKLFCLYQYQ